MTTLLLGKTVIVTGGASGIGRGIALAAARHGARAVIIADLTETPREGGPTTLALLAATKTAARFHRTDVTQRGEVQSLIEAAAEFGGVDVMACNAGIALPSDGAAITEADFAAILAVNLSGVLLCAQTAATQMRTLAKPGSIVITSSMGGLRGAAATVGYSASKGGVNLLAASLADAWGPHGIRVNTVCPGLIDTALVQSSPAVAAMVATMCERMPLRRLGRPEEIGDVVCWLGSDFSSFVTGAAIPADGGQTAII